ncbi:MAG: hypothetical protein HY820_14810 [Acidobacteria bacterium]|nr:hypothetical protein [Acidobacteriota bacterium]
MNAQLSQRAIEALASAPLDVQKAFIKQLRFLIRDLRHPGLHAKKFDESDALWQGRVTQDWRFYFRVVGDTYHIENIRSHSK